MFSISAFVFFPPFFLWPNPWCGINPEVRGQGDSLMKLFPHVFNVCEGKADAARGGGGGRRCWWESPSHMFLFPSLCAETCMTNWIKQTNKQSNSHFGTTSWPNRLRNYLNGFPWAWLKTTNVGISAYAPSHFLFRVMHLERGDSAHSTSCLISCL